MIIRRIASAGLLLAFATLLGISSWGNWQARAFNNPDGGNGDGYNPLSAEEYVAPEQFPLLFPPNAHLALSEQAATEGKIEAARQHASDALRSNPSSGAAALMLLDLYTRPNLFKTEVPPIAGTVVITESDSSDVNKEDTITTEAQPQEELSELPPQNMAFHQLALPDQIIADKLADINFALRPTYIPTLGTLAEYWSFRGEQEKAIHAWSDLLVNFPDASEQAFPAFHLAMKDPKLSIIFQDYLESAPTWWLSFFQYLLEHEPDPATIHRYYITKLHSPKPPTMAEQESYIGHLIHKKRWSEAYQIWVEYIKTQTERISLLYDGGFEDLKQQNLHFTWNISPTPDVKIKQESTSGITGRYALHLTFKKGNSIVFQHVSQTRVLAPGDYALEGRYKIKQLKTSKGLRWRLHCTDDTSNALLAESEAFKDNGDWKNFQVKFTVTDACNAQILRLESDSPYAHHNVFDGEMWFDDLAIMPKQ